MQDFKEVLEEQGIDPTLVEERMRNRSKSKSLHQIKAKKQRGMVDASDEDDADIHERIR